jgi:hypothetical protein
MEASPDWGPLFVAEALKQTASRGKNPNEAMGFGIPNALKAIELLSAESSRNGV